MNKELDRWDEIAGLISREKERALADFLQHEFFPGDLPARRMAPWPGRRLRLQPAIMAAAASLLLLAGLVSFWLLRGSWQNAPAVPTLNSLLADSFLFGGGRQAKETNAEPRADSSFAQALRAWGAPGLHRAPVPAAEPIDPSASVERGDPEEVRRKIGKVIRENTLEQLLARLRHNYKEV